MADQIDSDTCIGSKRRISVIEEALLLQQSSTSPAFLPHEDSLDSHIFLPSSPEKEQDIIQDIPSPSSFKKVRCSFDFADNQVPDFDPSEENSGSWNEERSRLADSVAGSFENERTCDDFWGKNETLGEKVEETESLGMGFGHNQRNADDVSGKDVKAEIKKESPSGACKEFDDYRKKAEMDSVIIENNEVSMVKESLLEARKKQLLQEVEAGSIFKDKAHVENVDSCDASSGILRSLKGINDSVRSSLKIEVIDDTALIEPVPFAETGNGGVKGGRNNGKKSVKQETEGKKVKRPRRKGKGVTKVLEMSEMQNKGTEADDTQNSVGERRDGMKRRYSRKEMETLRFINIVEQRQLWSVIYTGLGDSVIGQYDDLESSKHTKNVRLNFDPRQHFRRSYNVPGILGEASSEDVDIELEHIEEDELENVNILDPVFGQSVWGEDANAVTEGEYGEEYDSDEAYASIQRPAFLVEGEPDFESGPPEDGLEYLRRVRWEAAHIPKVKVAKVVRSKVKNEQSVYMPQIPDIAKCPDHLLPLKQWEDAFLADFSELRVLLSRNDSSLGMISNKLQSMTIVHKDNAYSPQPTSTILEKFNDLGTKEVLSNKPLGASAYENIIEQSSLGNFEGGKKTSVASDNPPPEPQRSDSSCNYPKFSTILAMDCVARVSKLRDRIRAAETMSSLSKNDCVWLFALCAAVDTPVDADTSASLRSLLRKCASLRATKSELDEEVVMLNILATIAGRYFGQSES